MKGMMSRMRVCDAAVEVLKETGNPAVMWGDVGLCHKIAERAGSKTDGHLLDTERRVIAALARQPGILLPKFTWCKGRRVRIFRLPEVL